jgi:hypothetical protein
LFNFIMVQEKEYMNYISSVLKLLSSLTFLLDLSIRLIKKQKKSLYILL